MGRWWGILGREFIPWASKRALSLPRNGDEAAVVVDALRAVRNKYRARKGKSAYAADTVLTAAFVDPGEWLWFVRLAARERAAVMVARRSLRPEQVEGWVSLVVRRLAFPGWETGNIAV